MSEYISIPEAAAKWGVSRQRVHQWIQAGRFDPIRIGYIRAIRRGTPRPKPLKKGRPKA